MRKIFGYKYTSDSSIFARGTVKGFVLAETVEEAMAHFGVTENNGYTSVCELTKEQFDREILDSTERMLTIERLKDEIAEIMDVAHDIVAITQELAKDFL